jgi:hypothetical protein
MSNWGDVALLLVAIFSVGISGAWRFGGLRLLGEQQSRDPSAPSATLSGGMLPASVSLLLLAAALLARDLAPQTLARPLFLIFGLLWLLSTLVLLVLVRSRPLWLLPERLRALPTEAGPIPREPVSVPKAIWWCVAVALAGFGLAIPLLHLPAQWIIGVGFGAAALLRIRHT